MNKRKEREIINGDVTVTTGKVVHSRPNQKEAEAGTLTPHAGSAPYARASVDALCGDSFAAYKAAGSVDCREIQENLVKNQDFFFR